MTSLTSIVILGDSIARGAGDTRVSPVGRGDYLAGTSPTSPYINIGNYGWIERSLAGLYPYVNLSVNGKTASADTPSLMPKQLIMLDAAPPTHAIVEVAANDLLGGALASIVRTRVQNIIIWLKLRYPGIICYITTVTPVANSTDSYVTLGNQFLSGHLDVANVNPVWSNYTDNTQTSGRSLYNSWVRANLVSGADGFIDVAAVASDPTDERFWNTAYGQASGDGLHPTQLLHTPMSQCYDVEAYFG